MQINDNALTNLSDWLFAEQPQASGADFMQTFSSALGAEQDNTALAANLVSALSGADDTSTVALSSSDAMFSALTQNMLQSLVQSALQREQTPEQLAAAQQPAAFADGTTPGFADVLDMVNPLQHIPLVSQYYQQWTGDDMGYVSQVAGGALWGGGLGVATSFLNIGLTKAMGKSPSDYIQQLLSTDSADAVINQVAATKAVSDKAAASHTAAKAVTPISPIAS